MTLATLLIYLENLYNWHSSLMIASFSIRDFIHAANDQQSTAAPVASVQQPSVVPGQQVSGIYDQGARFDSNRPANIPVNDYTCITVPL